jgi:hypothetical protein
MEITDYNLTPRCPHVSTKSHNDYSYDARYDLSRDSFFQKVKYHNQIWLCTHINVKQNYIVQFDKTNHNQSGQSISASIEVCELTW